MLLDRIEAREARVAVIGLGYVGLPLAVGFAEAGLQVAGIDVDDEKVQALNAGVSYITDIPSSRLHALDKDRLEFTTSYSTLEGCDVAIICVPTPLGKTRDPDLSFLIGAGEAIARHVHPGMLISLESTTYPGTTDELILPILEASGFKAGTDFFLSFSPERIDPGRSDYRLSNTPKVVGGFTPHCLEIAEKLYRTAIEQVVTVSSTQAAEMVKLLENTFRAVNIALVNEIAIMCDKLQLDVWEVVEAAASKPYGFMKFTPGPGVGGHCIPLDPHYLSWKLKTLNYNARFIQLAGEINSEMPRYWAGKVQDALNDFGKALRGSRVLVLGVAYKKDVDDVRESPALDIIELLHVKGTLVCYYDPHVSEINHRGFHFASEPDLDAALKLADCVVIATDHSSFDWTRVQSMAKVIVDTRNITRRAGKSPSVKVSALA